MTEPSASTQLPEQAKGFLGALFDFSFSEFITTKIIKVLYALAIVISGLVSIGWILKGFSLSFSAGLLALILIPLIFLLYVIAVRIWLELVIVIFRIAEHVKNIDPHGGGSNPGV